MPKLSISRLRNLTLQGRILMAILLPLAIVTAILVLESAQRIQAQGDASIQAQRQAMLEDRQQALKDLVQMAITAIEPLYANAGTEDDQAKRQAADILRSMRYGNNGYFLVFDHTGKVVALPPAPS